MPLVRQLLRVRRLLRGVPGGCDHQARTEAGYEIDFDLCTGCAICFEQCPCHAIEMVPEPRTET